MLASISCRQALGSFADAVDSLTVPRPGLVSQHLAACGSCTAYFVNYVMTIALVREAYLAGVKDVSQLEIEELTEAILAARQAL